MSDTAYVQSLLNDKASTGGVVELEPRYHYVPGGVVVPEHVRLLGGARDATVLHSLDFDGTVVTIQPGHFSGIENLSILGYNDPSATQSALVVPTGVVHASIKNFKVWFGAAAIYTNGVDCRFDDGDVGNSYGMAAIVSNGANWYDMVKIDSEVSAMGGYRKSNYGAFFQGDSDGAIKENHFTMCDFSGTAYDWSVQVDDGNFQPVMKFVACVFSAAGIVNRTKSTTLVACGLGGDWHNMVPGTPFSITGCHAPGAPVVVYGATAKGDGTNMNMAVL